MFISMKVTFQYLSIFAKPTGIKKILSTDCRGLWIRLLHTQDTRHLTGSGLGRCAMLQGYTIFRLWSFSILWHYQPVPWLFLNSCTSFKHFCCYHPSCKILLLRHVLWKLKDLKRCHLSKGISATNWCLREDLVSERPQGEKKKGTACICIL